MSPQILQYRPSNGTEGDAFMSFYCEKCSRDPFTEKYTCERLALSMAFEKGDSEYPRDWVTVDGEPTCLAFRLPQPPPPPQPGELLKMMGGHHG